jgi:hypothetical protein
VNLGSDERTLTINNTLTTFAGNLTGTVGLVKAGTGTLAVSNLRMPAVTVSSNQLRVIANGSNSGTSKVQSLSIQGGTTPTARLDLCDNDFIVDYSGESPTPTIRAQLKAAYATGPWTGNGIGTSMGDNKTYALGHAEASEKYGSEGGTFSGQSVDGTAVLIKYTYYGDANLDGMVDIVDLGVVGTNWQTAQPWWGGDFNYSDLVDIVDLGMVGTNWQKSMGDSFGGGGPSFYDALSKYPFLLEEALKDPYLSKLLEGGISMVPEPQIAVMTFAGLLGLRARRGRRQ